MRTLYQVTQPSRSELRRSHQQAYDQMAAQYAGRNLGAASLDHRRWLERFVAELPIDALVLDIGCGPGRDARCLAALGPRVLGVDLSSRMLSVAASEAAASLAQADGFELPVRTASVDGVLMASLVLHVPRPDLVELLAEARRVLRPGGVVALNTPIGVSEGWDLKPYNPDKHSYSTEVSRWFVYRTLAEVEDDASAAGFEVASIQYRQRHCEWLDVILLR